MTTRCRYRYEATEYPDLGSGCCWRPAWHGHERCIWHVDDTPKPVDELDAVAPLAGERLDGAVLSNTTLDDVDWLAETVLVDADLTHVSAERADFGAADLRNAILADASLREASFERANLEDAALQDADLKGANFVDARLHEATLTRSYVDRETAFGATVVYEKEFERSDSTRDKREAFDAATWTYRTLQFWCRENGLIDRTENFFVREKDLRRRYAWVENDLFHAIRAEGSRYLVGYGYRIRGILVASLFVIFAAAVLFPLLGGVYESTPTGTITYTLDSAIPDPNWETATVFAKSLYLSLVSFTTLGIGDVTPGSYAVQILSGVEALVGYVLLALLISVLARRRYWL